jgi:hypothetical protein
MGSTAVDEAMTPRKKVATMTTDAETEHEDPAAEEHPFAHLRATPEERARLLAAARPFDLEAWQRHAVPPTPEELADLEEFLRELEEMRRYNLEHDRLADLHE